MHGLDLTILAPAFVAGLLVLSTHVPLGQEVLRRGIIFIDIAIAQIAGLGVILAAQFGFEPQGLAMQLTATASALLGAWGLSVLARRRRSEIQEALIGICFVLAATGGIILLANNPHGGEHLRELLVGQILWITWPQLIAPALASAAILLLWFPCKFGINRELGFYLLFAVAVTLSVQLVGVYLVFATLIIPALAGRRYPGRRALVTAYLVGGLGYGFGLILSSILDLPSGAVIVWAIGGVALAGYFFEPAAEIPR
uniref:Zinc/manganese transport system permease protein n=1 Tax=Candidatus Kentrum sp. LFY TaxID=2126342 RepID=A0A450WQH2_9GAMM|nr:MAG: zinc/manganese transport system permease protein [Candidatus Kentron sp. LFY]